VVPRVLAIFVRVEILGSFISLENTIFSSVRYGTFDFSANAIKDILPLRRLMFFAILSISAIGYIIVQRNYLAYSHAWVYN